MKSRKDRQKPQPQPARAAPLAAPAGSGVLAGNIPPVWAGLLLVALTFLAYLPALQGGFIWDDEIMLTTSPVIKSPAGLFSIWFTTTLPDYFPLTTTSLWLEWRLWGMHPLGYHFTNILLHAASVVLLWRGLKLLAVPGAWLVAAIFAVHPVNVESVAWIAERKNTLTLFFYALAFWSYLRFESGSPASGPGASRWRWYALALGAFSLSLLSKTAAVMFPVALLLCAWWRRGKITWRDLWPTIPFYAAAASLGLVTLWFQTHRAIGGDVVQTAGFAGRLATAGWAVWFYLDKAVLPLNLIFVYPRWQVDPHTVMAWLPLLVLTLGFAASWHWRRGWGRAVLFGLGYFVVMLLPVAGFINIYFQRYSLVADHWQYFSLIGAIALAVAAVQNAIPGRAGVWPGRLLALAVVGMLSVLTWRQARLYASAETLWRETLVRNPACWVAYNNLGMILKDKGDAVAAEADYRLALKYNPDFGQAFDNLGMLLVDTGRADEAIDYLRKAVGLNFDPGAAHNDLGIALAQRGRFDEAMVHFRESVRYKPDNAVAYNSLANILVLRGQFPEAVPDYEEALRLNPGYAEAHNGMGYALEQLGRTGESLNQYQIAVRSNPDYEQAHLNLASLLVKLGRRDDAAAQLRETLRLNPDNAKAKQLLQGLTGAPGQ